MKRRISSFVNVELLDAVKRGRLDEIHVLLDEGAEIRDENHLILAASEFGRTNVVDFLLNKGHDIEKADITGRRALHLAAHNGHLELVEFLVGKNANLRASCSQGRKPIHFAAATGHKDLVEYFLNLGVSVDVTDHKNYTPLHVAAENENLDVVQCLVDRNANVNAKNDYLNTPLHLAVSKTGFLCLIPLGSVANDNTRLCQRNMFYSLIEAGANYNIKNNVGHSALYCLIHLCANFGYLDDLAYVFSKITNYIDLDNKGKSAAHVAVDLFLKRKANATKLLKLICQHQKDLNVEDIHGYTPLNYISRRWVTSRFNCIEIIKLLINNGAYLKLKDCRRIMAFPFLRKKLFTDVQLCTRAVVNKYLYRDIPLLYKRPLTVKLPPLHKVNVTNGQFQVIEQAVEAEIQTNGHCDLSTFKPNMLAMLCVKSYLAFFD